ncbi:MAG TPA: hypothetical protein VKV27_09975 [Solirubrobacteraceae bacterium]|nr:hypothetical protein [Solirubrobacteraceae bacterium]
MNEPPARKRTIRGAAAGAVAAAVWAAQQPLDKALFVSSYDDVELLGRVLVGGGDGWLLPGATLHLANGALFGAVYANLSPRLPLPAAIRGPVVALVEHLASWQLTGISDRVHPARDRLPRLRGNRAAFWQAAWRHLLFGTVLGELERRLNGQAAPVPPAPARDFSSNGHGSLEHAVTVHEAP